jgi:hypothetical protein
MLRARAPRASDWEHPRPEDPKVEAPERPRAQVELAEAVEGRRLRPQLEPKT